MSIRNKWKQTKGRWSLSLGLRGARVRVFEHPRSGIYYRDIWQAGRKDRKSLGTKDRKTAEQLGRQILSELLVDEFVERPPTLTLGQLWEYFERLCSTWNDNALSSKQDDRRRARLLLAFFGAGKPVAHLTENDQARYSHARRNGFVLQDGPALSPVGERTVQADLVLLHAMLRWGSRFRGVDGRFLLEHNPLGGVKIPAPQQANRPVATWQRYCKTQEAIQAKVQETSGRIRQRWAKLGLALFIAEDTGRRISAIRQLRWSDIDFENGTIAWRAEHDKRRRRATVPMSDKLTIEMRRATQEIREKSSEWVFPSEKDPAKPMDRHFLDNWLRRIEGEAGLAKLEGGLWHPYRRKWATERKTLPVKDVMAAGGWSDLDTLMKSYIQVDDETLRVVMNSPGKLVSAHSSH